MFLKCVPIFSGIWLLISFQHGSDTICASPSLLFCRILDTSFRPTNRYRIIFFAPNFHNKLSHHIPVLICSYSLIFLRSTAFPSFSIPVWDITLFKLEHNFQHFPMLFRVLLFWKTAIHQSRPHTPLSITRALPAPHQRLAVWVHTSYHVAFSQVRIWNLFPSTSSPHTRLASSSSCCSLRTSRNGVCT